MPSSSSDNVTSSSDRDVVVGGPRHGRAAPPTTAATRPPSAVPENRRAARQLAPPSSATSDSPAGISTAIAPTAAPAVPAPHAPPPAPVSRNPTPPTQQHPQQQQKQQQQPKSKGAHTGTAPAAPASAGYDAMTPAEKKRHRKEEKLREKRRRREEAEAAKREAAPPQRRTIPPAPHRQLFLVDGYYCGADPSQPLSSEAPLLAQQSQQEEVGEEAEDGEGEEGVAADARDGRDPVGGGGGGVSRPGVDPAALSNRIGTAPGGPRYVGPAAKQGNRKGGGKTNTTSANGLSFYISPSVPASFQIGGNVNSNNNSNNNNNNNNNHSSNSRGASPSSPLPQASESSTGKSHTSRKLKKLRIKQRFYEPVELQVESLSALIMRLTLFLWYAGLLTALVIEVIPRVQWSLVNVCGSNHHTDLRRVERWSSPCVTSAPMPAGTSAGVVLTWPGRDIEHLHAKLVRYRRVAVSLPTPADQVESVVDYDLVASTTMESGGLFWTANRSIVMRCHKKNSRCDMVRVPEDLLGETRTSTSYNFSLAAVPPSLAAGAASGAVGVAYQRSAYTLATVIWRYVLIFLSFIHALRFIAFRKYTSTLYEQGWTLALQIALMWYLDPLFALNITSWPMPSVLAFLEYRIPTYFMAVMIAYMLSVMTASMAWATPKKLTGTPSLMARAKALLLQSRNVYDPPMWTKILVFMYVVCVFVIDIIDACVDENNWFAASNSNVHFKRIYWAVIALLLFGGLICLILLLYLRNYLGAKPYLESRPQQLACRVFIMIFLSTVVYSIIHCLVFFLLYNRDYTVCASQQPFLQLPSLIVASFFVNIMTLVYTSQSRNDNVPINPKDFRWKHMVWPDTWYRWLARHGGSQYIFATENEETRFYRLQFEFRKRQFMAKQKRKMQPQESSGMGLGTLYNDTSEGGTPQTYDQSTSLGTQRDGTHSGFLSMFHRQHTMSGTSTRRGSRGQQQQQQQQHTPLWRTDVWETPMASQLVSPVASEPGGSRRGTPRQPGGFPSSSLADTGVALDGTTGGDGRRGSGRDASHRGRYGAANAGVSLANNNNNTINNTSVNFFANSRNASVARMRDGGGHDATYNNSNNNMTSVNLAARSILNMDRFSTYFLADGDNGGVGSGGLAATPYTGPATSGGNLGSGGIARRQNSRLSSAGQSPQREPSSAFDAYEVEGPARHRSRLLQQQQQQNLTSSGRRRESSLLRREHTTTLAEYELGRNHTFAGFEAHASHPRTGQAVLDVTTPLRVGPGSRGGMRHLRSRSDGDVPMGGMGSGHMSPSTGSSPLPPAHLRSPQQSQQQQQQRQRHHDPMQGPPRAASADPGVACRAREDSSTSKRHEAAAAAAAAHNDETDPCFSGSVDTAADSTSGTLHVQQSEALLQAIRSVQQESFASPSMPPSHHQQQRGPHALPTFTATPTSVQPSGATFQVRPAGAKTQANLNNNSTSSAAEATSGQQAPRPQHRRRASPQPYKSNVQRGGTASNFNTTFASSLRGAENDDDMASDLSPSSSDSESVSSGSSEEGERGHNRKSFFHTLSVMRERLGAVMGAAERNLLEKPVRNLDRFEMQIFDAAYKPFQSLHYLPFFNLETAIDCYNISWEAYGVEKSVGDEMIETGIKMTPQNVPKTVAHGVKKLVCGCCPAEDDSSQDEEDEDSAVEADNEREVQNGATASAAADGAAASHHDGSSKDNARGGSVRYPRSHPKEERKGDERREEDDDASASAAVPPASNAQSTHTAGAAPSLTTQEQEAEEMLARHGSVTVEEDPHQQDTDNGKGNGRDTAVPALHRRTVHNSEDAVVIVHMSGEGSQNNVPKAERAPADEQARHQLTDAAGKERNANQAEGVRQASAEAEDTQPSRGIAQGGPTTTHDAEPPASTPAVATDSNLFPINVEKYGFTLLLVAEAKEVQVIMVKMDTSAPEHRGKAPRLIIGFRGTANMSNAKYDMNIHRVVWREMERVESEDNDEGLLSRTPLDMASTMDGASSMGTRHLGCAACLRSCVRFTSWRPTCHAGFLSIWKTLKPTVMRRVREILHDDPNTVYRIFTTGHSLGGALASLCAYSLTAMLRRMDYPIPEVTVYTYGQPRIGNRTFQRIYNKAVPRSFRIVNESDVVVTMTMFGGYHVGIEVDVDRNGNFIVKPTEMEKLFPPTKGRGLTVINHLMTNYGISLNAIATRTTCPARGLECYLTADPDKIEREKAKEEALKLLQENKKPAEANTHAQ